MRRSSDLRIAIDKPIIFNSPDCVWKVKSNKILEPSTQDPAPRGVPALSERLH